GSILPDERGFDEACLRRMGKRVGVTRFLWGFVTAKSGRPVVRLHFWQQGEGDRAVALPYEPAARERLAERLYRKLVTPEKVGDVTVTGAFEGELAVDGVPDGTFSSRVELTLPGGEHLIEVRKGPRLVARARVRVAVGGQAEATLEAVVAPAEPAPPGPVREPPRGTLRPRPSPLPWVLGSTAAVGLVGAGVFWSLRAGEASDLTEVCADERCPERASEAVDRGRTWTALSAVSLGVGVVAGAGLAAYLVTQRRAPAVVVVPWPGGVAAGVAGVF
ncbi:MAG TPA: hypothetical protein VFS00_00335, partial [Polyangiaceae bacterium]|nr:hypothetical protein [Polyangiaceae bacterium]